MGSKEKRREGARRAHCLGIKRKARARCIMELNQRKEDALKHSAWHSRAAEEAPMLHAEQTCGENGTGVPRNKLLMSLQLKKENCEQGMEHTTRQLHTARVVARTILLGAGGGRFPQLLRACAKLTLALSLCRELMARKCTSHKCSWMPSVALALVWASCMGPSKRSSTTASTASAA